MSSLSTVLESCEGFYLILDTSVLMNIGSGRPSLENLCDATGTLPVLIIPRAVLAELENLTAESRPSTKLKAITALKVLRETKLCKVVFLNESISSHADDEVFLIAKKLASAKCRVAVATSDKALRRRCRMIGIPTVFLRETQLRFYSDYQF